MLTTKEKKKAVHMYRIGMKKQEAIARELKVQLYEVSRGIEEYEEENNLRENKQATTGDVIEFSYNDGYASGVVVKEYVNSVLVQFIDIEIEPDNRVEMTVVNHKNYRVVNVNKIK
ncbi:DUF2187 family protein [Bacillus cereus group sp. MYBK15-3]|uniref:DUF2187 family protein n=1 Tax=Bacillus cereus group TaxID=86661 RepID=UPI001C8C0E3F|nr:DUF2187 family protein [Bacillus cereus]MBX9158299.1 DUF2187 family protein [Bacillus cereus]